MASTDPVEQHSLGKKVKNYDEGEWHKLDKDVMREGLIAKFMQNGLLASTLKDTGESILYECNPHDSYWGNGTSFAKFNVSQIKGQNHLGKLLVEVRSELVKL